MIFSSLPSPGTKIQVAVAGAIARMQTADAGEMRKHRRIKDQDEQGGSAEG